MFRSACAALILLTGGCMTAAKSTVDPNRTGLQRGPDTCGASRYARLLGRSLTQAPPQGSIENYRLAPVDAVLTADLRPERLNIFFEDRSGKIVGIRCF